MESTSLSPEPGSFPKRRVARLTVPPADAEHQAPGIPSCHSDAPSVFRPPSASPRCTRRPPFRLSKPGYQAVVGPQLYQTLFSTFMVLLLVGVVSMSSYKTRQLKAVVSALEQKHKDDINMQVAWLSTSMTEHEQCKAALQQADTDHKSAKAGLATCQASVQKCEAERKQSSSASDQTAASQRAAAAQLKVDLESTKIALQLAQEKLQKEAQQLKEAREQLSTHEQQRQQFEAQIEVLQQQLREEQQAALKGKLQQQSLQQEKDALLKGLAQGAPPAAAALLAPTAPLSADAHAARTATAAAVQSTSATGSAADPASNVPVVVVMCSASDLAPVDLITPWSEAVVAAGVSRVMLVSDDAGCVAAAKAAGVKVLQHTFQVPAIPGPLAVQNAQAYRRYAVVQQVLLLGHGCVSVQPELLLLSDPLPLLPQHPADVSVLSTAWGDEHQAYGHMSPSPAGQPAASTFQISSLSTALVSLQPQAASLDFVNAMLEGLAAGQHSEQALLNTLLLSPWHLHDAAHTGSGSSSGSQGGVPALPAPVRLSVLPPGLFTSSHVVFGAQDPRAWLKQHQPMAVQLLPGAERAAQAKAVLQWLEADIQEVIKTLDHLPGDSGVVQPTAAAAATGGAAGSAGSAGGTAHVGAPVATPVTHVQPPALPPQGHLQAAQQQEQQQQQIVATAAATAVPTHTSTTQQQVPASSPVEHTVQAVPAVAAVAATAHSPEQQGAVPSTITVTAPAPQAATPEQSAQQLGSHEGQQGAAMPVQPPTTPPAAVARRRLWQQQQQQQQHQPQASAQQQQQHQPQASEQQQDKQQASGLAAKLLVQDPAEQQAVAQHQGQQKPRHRKHMQ